MSLNYLNHVDTSSITYLQACVARSFRNKREEMILQKLCSGATFAQICFSNGGKILPKLNENVLQNNHFIGSYRNFIRGPRTRISSNQKPVRPQAKGIAPNPFEGLPVQNGPIEPSRMLKPFIFTIAFSAGSFMAVAVWEYENLRMKAMRLAKGSSFNWFRSKLNQRRQQDWRKEVDSWWNQLTPGEKVFAPICFLNILVFFMWKNPRLQPMMVTYFCSNPAARVLCWPMFLSTFSHYSLFHIFANMYVLHSFTNVAVAALGKEQFLGLYLSAGVVSTFASYVYKVATSQPGLSLGASGAIMAILALVCTEYPETQLSILFLPNVLFTAGSAIKVIMGIDLAGCILGWKFFDHAAHLGGALFGLFWSYIGSTALWPKREHFLQQYHRMRTSK